MSNKDAFLDESVFLKLKFIGLEYQTVAMQSVIDQSGNDLRSRADEKTRESGKRFFKEEVKTYGVKTNHVSIIAKACFKEVKHTGKAEIFSLCEALWQSGYLEESFIACQWSYSLRKNYEPADFEVFESWLNRYVTNWASCDTFCNHTIGEFIEMHPGFIVRLKEWTQSDNRWMRRGSAVSLIVPARKGKFLNDVFEITDALLTDKDDMIQKGYGWMLKAASQVHQKEVYDYVISRKQEMPRTAFRYALEKMPDKMRKEGMKKG